MRARRAIITVLMGLVLAAGAVAALPRVADELPKPWSDAARLPERLFMDLPGARSHEYFPKLSNDGRWLVWGATAEGHEHDRADYEIFAWEVGTPVEQAVRLTHHPGNDNWPGVWVRPRG